MGRTFSGKTHVKFLENSMIIQRDVAPRPNARPDRRVCIHLKYELGVVPRAFRNMEMKALGVL